MANADGNNSTPRRPITPNDRANKSRQPAQHFPTVRFPIAPPVTEIEATSGEREATQNTNKNTHTSQNTAGANPQPRTQIAITSSPDVLAQQMIHQSKANNKGYTFALLEFSLHQPSPRSKQRAPRQRKTTKICILLIYALLPATNQHENCMAPISYINLLVGEFLWNYDEKLRRYATVMGLGCVKLVMQQPTTKIDGDQLLLRIEA